MATVDLPRPLLDKAVWSSCAPCPMSTLDTLNFPIVAATPADWYQPWVFVSGCENPANTDYGSSGLGGGSFLYNPAEDAWEDIPHFLGMDPDYSVAGTYSHGAATFHPVGPTGTLTAATSITATTDKYLPGEVTVGAKIRITGGTGAGQERTITAASGATRSDTYLPRLRAGSLASGVANNGGDRSVSTPVGVQQNDLMVTVFYVNNDIMVLTPPSGWVEVASSPGGFIGMRVFVKVAGASEPGSYTWTIPVGYNLNWHAWAIQSATFVQATYRYPAATYDNYVWATNTPMRGHRLGQVVEIYSRNNVNAISIGGVSAASTWEVDLADVDEMPSTFRNSPSLILQTTDTQTAWINIVAQATGSYTASTDLTVDSAWSVTPDATSTYAIDSGSFWCWRGNASDSAWRWAKYDIAQGTWEQKTAADAVVVPTFVAVSATASKTSSVASTIPVSVPAGTADGDLMLLVITGTLVYPGTGPASGWTELIGFEPGSSANNVTRVYYRVASSEPASYDLTGAAGSGRWLAHIVTYRNAGTPSPIWTGQANRWDVNPTATLSGKSGNGAINSFNASFLPGLYVTLTGNSLTGDETYPITSPVGTTRINAYDASAGVQRLEDWPITTATGADEVALTTTFQRPDGTPVFGAATSVIFQIPGTAPGMSNYGKADPSGQGGIHATTDSDNYIYLGGDAQTSLRRYSISGDSWSALSAHEPYTRPLRNVGGGMVYQVVDGDPYIFYWCPMEGVVGGTTAGAIPNAYDNTARFYAYDLTNNVWLDLFAFGTVTTPSDMPTKFSQVAAYAGKLIFFPQGVTTGSPISAAIRTAGSVIAQDPTKVDTWAPEQMSSPARPNPWNGGGTPFVVEGDNGDVWLYFMEHTNVQAIQPLRCRIDGRSWV